jgi:hypothetical protein
MPLEISGIELSLFDHKSWANPVCLLALGIQNINYNQSKLALRKKIF